MAEGMENKHADNERNKNDRSWLGIIIRFVVAAIVLMVTSLITPGFSNMGFGTALLAAVVIAAIDYVIQRYLNGCIAFWARYRGISFISIGHIFNSVFCAGHGSQCIRSYCGSFNYWYYRCHNPRKCNLMLRNQTTGEKAAVLPSIQLLLFFLRP